MQLEQADGLRVKVQTSEGLATGYSPMKLAELGCDPLTLPYSIRVLVENVARHSGRVEGAQDALHELARWPSSVGGEMPFMPHRVLLQDYTGVPLVVDLAAMRDAAKATGADATRVNSQVPVDLVIDHSIQVDAWGDPAAFSLNLDKEYERNSERYALLKWAQSSFRNMRVFPPGKGICHQFNLEYLSKVVATGTGSEGLQVFPDTLVGTDSHTTMVNGLGILGWGVGGIEAEAVMLGEPYHMPIPKVFGVKLTGSLREGVTPTDLVLAVTERLRGKNVVGSFVEYFGDGYSHLSVPDRATLGNMSPEYGATVGYCPIDEATLAYLKGTARPADLIDLVRRYATEFGLFVGEAEPKYSEVVVVDLDSIEPSVAGPRNPEERRTLTSVPSFASGMLHEWRESRGRMSGVSSPGAVQSLVEEPKASFDGMGDGSVVISAITSCTNTSNPTVMVGAGLLAKKAVEAGLKVKPWVKPSLAPGSTVVTDYLGNAGLLKYLYELGYNLVGYGCTTCIAEGTPVLMADGTTRRIESLPVSGGATVFAPSGEGRLKMGQQSALYDNGSKDCVELVLQDGRSLTCTYDHQLLCADGRWVRADQLIPGRDRVVVGLDAPLDSPLGDEVGYKLHVGDMSFGTETLQDRSRLLAFARIVGHLLGDGSISSLGQCRMNAGQALDREMMLNDVEVLTGLRPAASRYDVRKWSIALPNALSRSIESLPGVLKGKRITQPPVLPDFVLQKGCPTAVVREFLGALFGADGHAPTLHRWGDSDDDASLEPPAFSQSTIPAHLERTREMMRELSELLARCGVRTGGIRIYDYPTRRSASTYPPPADGIPRIEVRMELPDGLSFVERVGFRYSVDKSLKASAAASYWRLVEGIRLQRLWMSEQLRELHALRPELSFTSARRMVVSSLVGHEREADLPPVVSPHYALLDGTDRFSRLPMEGSRRFSPLHRRSAGFPSPPAFLAEIGAGGWFPSLSKREQGTHRRGYAVEKEALTLPTMSLRLIERRPAGQRVVYDLTVDEVHAFVAGTMAVHNCIGNSGPLSTDVEARISTENLYAVAVLSGNRNFDGRIHPLVKGAFLMSPMLVVAYGLAGRIDFDFQSTPLGVRGDGTGVFLKDIWPGLPEIKAAVEKSLSSDLYARRYADAAKGDEKWESLASYADEVFHWDASSTYIRHPHWFDPGLAVSVKSDVVGARALAVLEDKVTTDHISPAGTIPVDSPAGKYLTGSGVDMIHFSSYGSRRGNHEVMVRGGFSNIRLRNLLSQGKEGGYTTHNPSGRLMSIYDASVEYAKEGVPLVIIAGKQYGMGSSRDWAAKAPRLLGVRAVIAQDFERIHRSNLVAMGVLPLQFKDGESAKSLGLRGDEKFSITGVEAMTGPRQWVDVVAASERGETRFKALCRVDNETELRYIEKGGVLPYVFDRLLRNVP